MDGRTVPKIRTGTDFGTWYGFSVRNLLVRYVVRNFGPDFFRYGTWYGLWYGLDPGPVRGTDFGTKKSVPERIFFGTDVIFEKLIFFYVTRKKLEITKILKNTGLSMDGRTVGTDQ